MPTNASPAENAPDENVTGRRIDNPPQEQPAMEPAPVQEVNVVEDAGPSAEPMATPEDATPAEDVKRVTTVDGNDGVTREFPQE